MLYQYQFQDNSSYNNKNTSPMYQISHEPRENKLPYHIPEIDIYHHRILCHSRLNFTCIKMNFGLRTV